jgi:predicted dehydrogenase
MSSPARVALLGYGLAGSCFHAPFITTTPGLELAAIVTRDEDRRTRARRDHPGVFLLDSADDVWTNADDFDLVVVAAPNRAHVPLALSALAAGLPVVVDKPLAPDVAEARRLVEKADERGVMLTVFQNRRWDGDFLTLRRLLEQEAMGEVFRFESRFERWRPQVAEGWRERPAPEEGGGVLFDLGSHLVDQALQLFGPVRSVYGELEARRSGARVDDDAFIALEHESGVHSHLWMSAVAAQSGPRFRVLGKRAAFTKYGLDVQEEALRAGIAPGGQGWGQEPPELRGQLGTEGNLRRVRTEPGSYGAFYEAVAAMLRDGAPPPVDPEDAVTVLEILERVRLANAAREPVEVERASRT